MTAVAFDTLKFARALREKAKLSPEQAEGVADELVDVFDGNLATKADIPNRCGLMVRSERGWRTVRKGIRNPTELDRTLALKLISLRPNWSDSATWLERHGHSAPDYLRDQARKEALARAGRDLSKEIAEAVKANIEGREQTSEAAKRIVAGAEKERDKILAECADLLGALGIDPDTSPWQISTEIRKRAALLIAGESAVGALTRACDEAAKALERGRLLADLAVPRDGGPEPAP